MDFTPFTVVILPTLTVLAVGLLGSTRRIGFWLGLLFSIILTPVGGLIVALISGPKRRPSARKSDLKKSARKP